MDRRNFMKGGIGSSLLALLPCRKLSAKAVREVTITQGRPKTVRDCVEVTKPQPAAKYRWRSYAPLRYAFATLTTNSSPVTNASWPDGEAIPYVGERINLMFARDMCLNPFIKADSPPDWYLRGTCIECFPAKKHAYPEDEVTSQYVIRISGEMVKV